MANCTMSKITNGGGVIHPRLVKITKSRGERKVK